MPYPTLQDDGQTVTLDLHGATVDEAVALTRRVLDAAARRGRRNVKVIHGRSTSDQHSRTIKHALHALLDQGALDAWVTDAWRGDAILLLALDVTARPDVTPLRLPDVL